MEQGYQRGALVFYKVYGTLTIIIFSNNEMNHFISYLISQSSFSYYKHAHLIHSFASAWIDLFSLLFNQAKQTAREEKLISST